MIVSNKVTNKLFQTLNKLNLSSLPQINYGDIRVLEYGKSFQIQNCTNRNIYIGPVTDSDSDVRMYGIAIAPKMIFSVSGPASYFKVVKP